MKTTTALRWVSLASRLHPPSPLSRRDSAKILSLLSSSFRKELDRQYPAGLPDLEKSTDTHLRSILENPLFTPRDGASGDHKPNKAIDRIQDLMSRPMDVFAKQVAIGSATLSTAATCLQTHLNNALASPDEKPSVMIANSGAGTFVADWLWSSGLEESGRFYQDHYFLQLIVSSLTAESKHDKLLGWLRRLELNVHKRKSAASVKEYFKFLQLCILSEIRWGKGLESAIALFIRAAEDTQPEIQKSPRIGRCFRRVASALTAKLVYGRDEIRPQSAVIQSFVQLVKKEWASPDTRLIAFHDVYLVADPMPATALEYLKRLSAQQLANQTRQARSRTVLLSLRTAELCLDKDQQIEAMAVLNFLQHNFSSEIGLHPPSSAKYLQEHLIKEEERNLCILDNLATA